MLYWVSYLLQQTLRLSMSNYVYELRKLSVLANRYRWKRRIWSVYFMTHWMPGLSGDLAPLEAMNNARVQQWAQDETSTSARALSGLSIDSVCDVPLISTSMCCCCCGCCCLWCCWWRRCRYGLYKLYQGRIIQCAQEAPPQGKREHCQWAKVYKLKQRRLKNSSVFTVKNCEGPAKMVHPLHR